MHCKTWLAANMRTKDAILMGLIIEFGILAWAVINYGIGIEGIQAMTRLSEYFLLLLFSILFLISDISKVYFLLSGRPYHLFSLAAVFYLAALLLLFYFSGGKVTSLRAVGILITYIFIFSMPFLTNKRDAAKLENRKFRIFEMLFLYYIWFFFFLTYLPRVSGSFGIIGGTYTEHVLVLGWVSLMLGMKLPGVLIRSKPNMPRQNQR